MLNLSINSKRQYLFKVIIVVGFLLLSLLAAEIILRLKGDTYSWAEKNGHGYQSAYDQPCKLKWVVDASYQYDKIEYQYHVDVNEIGIRDTYHSKEKGVNTLRIVGLGDSFTEGAGAPFDSTWLSILGKIYKKGDYDSIEVISGGVSGSDLIYSYKLFQDYLSDYNPDIVIFSINHTDVTDYFVRGGMHRFKEDTCFTKESPKLEWLFRRSHLVRSVMLNVLGYNWQIISNTKRDLLWSEFHKEFGAIILSLKEDSNTAGYKLYFVFHPLIHEVEKGTYDFDFENLKRKLDSHNIRSIDLLPALREYTVNGDSISKAYWPIDQHLNSRGYHLFARTINEQIESSR